MPEKIVNVQDTAEAVQQLVTAVAPELWWILVQSLATVAIMLSIYKVLNSIVSYFFVRFDKELGKNVGVVIEGRKGYIAHISMRHLIIKYDEIPHSPECGEAPDVHSGNELLIPINSVLSRSWEIIRRKD
jgi:hypothetical protein